MIPKTNPRYKKSFYSGDLPEWVRWIAVVQSRAFNTCGPMPEPRPLPSADPISPMTRAIDALKNFDHVHVRILMSVWKKGAKTVKDYKQYF
jgi:hypothetical protein